MKEVVGDWFKSTLARNESKVEFYSFAPRALSAATRGNEIIKLTGKSKLSKFRNFSETIYQNFQLQSFETIFRETIGVCPWMKSHGIESNSKKVLQGLLLELHKLFFNQNLESKLIEVKKNNSTSCDLIYGQSQVKKPLTGTLWHDIKLCKKLHSIKT